MKKLLLLLGIVGLSTTVDAQEPDYNIAPDFTVTDINGVNHNLYSYLDAGKTVVLDLFATWCGPCWNYAGHPASSTHPNFGALETFYSTYGPAGTDEVVVIAIESDANTNAADLDGSGTNTTGDWITGTLYPLVDDASVKSLFNLSYYPTVVMICPDRYAYEIGQASVADFYTGVGNCPSIPTNANDPRIVGQESDEMFCTGDVASMKAVVQNYGTSALTSLTIEVFDGSSSVLTKNWTGNLAMYEMEEINLGTVSPTGATNYSIEITSGNDDSSNDDIGADVAPAPILMVGPVDPEIVVNIAFDGYASEFGIVFDAGLPTQDLVTTYRDAADGTTSPLHFVEIGTYADGDATADVTMSTNTDGCHYVLFVDNFGDGLTDPSTGSISMQGNSSSSNTINVDVDYGQGTFVLVDVQTAVSVEELNTVESSLYPNPVHNQDVTLELADVTGEVEIRIMDITGKVVSSQTTSVNGKVILPTQSLEAGVYVISLTNEAGSTTQRLIVE